MQVLYDMCEMLDDELREVVKKGDMSPTELDRVYKAVDIIKDIKTIEAMEDYSYDDYSRRNSYADDNMSYNMSRNSYARRGRDGDGDGRYSEDSSYRRGRDRYSRDNSYEQGYSGHEDKQQMLQKIEMMKKQIEQM